MNKLYRSAAGVVYGFALDGSEDSYILPGMVQMTIEEIEAHLNPPIDPAESMRRLMVNNNAAYNSATLALTADYPQLEKDTWPTQDNESKSWVADPDNALTPWIDRAAATRGIERAEYLRRTLAKARQFELVSSYLTGTRQKYEDQIKAGADPVLDYTIPGNLYAEMQAQALLIMTTNAAELQELL